MIIANDTTGYNGSRHQSFQIAVHNCDCILVTFVNNSTSQSHGLAIAYYENSGVVVQPNKSDNVKFLATKSGQFRVSEQIKSVHAQPDAPSDKQVSSKMAEKIEHLGEFLGAKEVVHTAQVPKAWKNSLR